MQMLQGEDTTLHAILGDSHLSRKEETSEHFVPGFMVAVDHEARSKCWTEAREDVDTKVIKTVGVFSSTKYYIILICLDGNYVDDAPKTALLIFCWVGTHQVSGQVPV